MKTKKKRLYQTNLLFLVIGILLSLSAGFHLYIVLAKQQRSDVEKLSTIYAERTESLINGIFHKTDVLAAAVKLENGDISQEEFDTLAQLVYQENSGIRGIQYMPGAVVTYSYPIEGNEAVIGKNFLEIPERKKDVLLAIDTKKIALSGPYQLLQGGLGVVARNPIFLYDDAGREYFWGFSAIVLNLPDALQDAQLAHLNDSGYDFQLYNINENEERIVIAGDENLDTSKAICSAVSVPNHERNTSCLVRTDSRYWSQCASLLDASRR
jgi:Predicted periplasmic ligand-binding sensor domain